MNRRVLLYPSEIAEKSIESSIKKSILKPYELIPLGILAGVFISIGAITSTSLRAIFPDSQSHIASLLGAAIFSIGIVLVVIAGGELFNGNVLMFLARLDKKITTKSMIKNWCSIYLLNFLGTLIIAFIIYQSNMFTQSISNMFESIARIKSSYGFIVAFLEGSDAIF